MTKTTAAPVHPVLVEVTSRIIDRSRDLRRDYLDRMTAAGHQGRSRSRLSCGNLAHGFAASPARDKLRLRGDECVNIGIVTAYNDMLSAHQPFAGFPDIIKAAARDAGATAQVAGGVPAMCDGVTQGRAGMELSLFSRDVIALSTAIALSHDMFDAVIALGVCDKIVPGLVMGALSFGHLPVILAPAGPMTSGLPNKEKAAIRAQFAQGQIGREALLEAEAQSYHGPGTCTFYGTANSNQMLMELMGLHVPGSAFINPGTPLRDALTKAATTMIAAHAQNGTGRLADILDARSFVNAIIGLMATGGSTNHALHLPAMARAAGFIIDWNDFADLSAITPLLARIYPNGQADVNHFHAAGGMAFLTRELLDAGLLHRDVMTIAGPGLDAYAREPKWLDGQLTWADAIARSLDLDVLRPVENPFDAEGGLRLLTGNLGRAIIKLSAVSPQHRVVEAPAIVFNDQSDFDAAFKRGDLNRDFVAVLRFQGPKANGMPELHSLSPALSVLQDRGFKVALVTDGRMSGASGKTPAAIHVTPEACDGGPIAQLTDGDIVRVDGNKGLLDFTGDPTVLLARPKASAPRLRPGMGRELFDNFRKLANAGEMGASVLF